tara:strand:- start:42 stop:245 length:204 start_codon:yes stop_codon:yes gene_type:complete
MIIREVKMEAYLHALALQTGHSSNATISAESSDAPFTFEKVYDDEIEALFQDAYTMDYATFCFGCLK